MACDTRSCTLALLVCVLDAVACIRSGDPGIHIQINTSLSGEPGIHIQINTSLPLHVTEREFLSLGMDSNLIRNHWETWDFTSRRLRTLAEALSPAYLRLCGTDGDRLQFQRDPVGDNPVGDAPDPGPPFPASNFTMSAYDWDRINRFAADVGWRIMFGFNAQLRRGDQWDADNAGDLLAYSLQQGYASNLDFELGNEPDLYFLNKNMVVISGKQLAEDYKQLRGILDRDFDARFASSKIYGPGLAFVLPIRSPVNSLLFLAEFLMHLDEGVIEAVTWHHYYGGSELKYRENYTDPDILNQYVTESSRLVSVVKRSRHPDINIWQGETSSTNAPSGTILEESYIAGFMLLDKLGVSARFGMKLVIRQTFYGFWFALVDEKLNPVPNYWVALLYRALVGTHVLNVTDGLTTSRYVRVYANCVARTTSAYSKDAAVIYAMNLGESDVYLDMSSIGSRVYEYLFSPGDEKDPSSTKIRLNDQLLLMTDNSTLPNLMQYGRTVTSSKHVLLPSTRFAFYVIDDAGAGACK